MFRAPSLYLAQESTKMGGGAQGRARLLEPLLLGAVCVCGPALLTAPSCLPGAAAQHHSVAQTRVRSQGDAGEQVKEAVARDFIDIGDARTF